MQRTRRVVIASILGLIAGGISWAGSLFVEVGAPLSLASSISMALLWALLGFSIGISSLRWHWVIHGMVLGLIFGVVFGVTALGLERSFWPPLIMGLIYGFLIELITTKALKTGVAD